MSESYPQSTSIVIGIDGDIGRQLLTEFEPSELRPAPSVRGADFIDSAAIILLSAGSISDVMSLILAKEHISEFCRRLVSLLQQSRKVNPNSHLSVDLTSKGGKITVDLKSSDSAKLADALRALANLTDETKFGDDN